MAGVASDDRQIQLQQPNLALNQRLGLYPPALTHRSGWPGRWRASNVVLELVVVLSSGQHIRSQKRLSTSRLPSRSDLTRGKDAGISPHTKRPEDIVHILGRKSPGVQLDLFSETSHGARGPYGLGG